MCGLVCLQRYNTQAALEKTGFRNEDTLWFMQNRPTDGGEREGRRDQEEKRNGCIGGESVCVKKVTPCLASVPGLY